MLSIQSRPPLSNTPGVTLGESMQVASALLATCMHRLCYRVEGIYMLARYVWFPLVLALCLVCCANTGYPHLLRTGGLTHPVVLHTDLFDIEVVYLKAGYYWTNVWMDVRVHAKSTEEQLFDPRELELFSPSLRLSFKHTQHQTFIHASGALSSGDRDDLEGQRDWTPPTKVRAQTTIQATLMFETNRNQAEDLRSFDLVYRGQRVSFQEVRTVQQASAAPEIP